MRVFHRPSLSDDHKPVEICGADPHMLGVRPRERWKPMPMSPDDFASTTDAVDQVVELVNGVRARFEAEGYSPTAAEQMAVAFFQLASRGQGSNAK